MKLFLTYCFLFLTTIAFCQQITPSVFSTAGNSVSGHHMSYSYTIGQLISPTFTNSNKLTQGFNQPIKIIAGKIKNDTDVKCSFNTYPNPVTDYATITLSGFSSKFIIIEIYNMLGSLIFTNKTPATNEKYLQYELNLTDYPQGYYVVRLLTEDRKKQLASVNLIKQ